MSRIRTLFAVAVVGGLLAACSGASTSSTATAGSSSVPSSTAGAPSVSPSSEAVLPVLLDGWVRYEVPGYFTVGIPETWMVLTALERDDAAAADAIKVRFPDFTGAIDSGAAMMREQGTDLHAWDVANPSVGFFYTNLNIMRVPGPLTADWATAAAAEVQGQFAIAEALSVEPVATPSGAYRYQFAEGLVDGSLAGMQYLVPAGSDVYVLTFMTTVEQTEGYGATAVAMADSFAIVPDGTATATAPADGTATAPSITVQGESATLSGAGPYTLVSDTSNIADTHGGYLYLGDGAATASYTVEIPADGTYYVWIRDSDDGLHADGARSVSVTIGDTTLEWRNESRDTMGWAYDAAGSFSIGGGAREVTFTKLESTSAAFSMDEFILSTDPNYHP